MSNITITYNDLMLECNISDAKVFRSLLKKNNLLLSSKKLISQETADNIAYRLIGKKMNWYKYKQKERDEDSSGPLKNQYNQDVLEAIEKWFSNIVSEMSVPLNKNHLVGMVINGGFLEGETSDFILSLSPGMNILIGDRGTGKSTILNLLGLFSTSISEETNILIRNLLNLFTKTPFEIGELNRHIRTSARKYAIELYANFFVMNSNIYCYYVDFSQKNYCLFQRVHDNWEFTNEDSLLSTIPLRTLYQGESIKIAEAENAYYLNNILDALYPDLYMKRNLLANKIYQFNNQFANFKPRHEKYNLKNAIKLLDEIKITYSKLQYDFNEQQLSESSIKRLQRLIEKYNHFAYLNLPQTIVKLIEETEESIYFLFWENKSQFKSFVEVPVEEILTLQDKQKAIELDPYKNISFEFNENEFGSSFSILDILQAIKAKNIRVNTKSKRDMININELNRVLRIPNLYDSIISKRMRDSLSTEILNLEKYTEEIRQKQYYQLEDYQKDQLTRLNRLILEDLFPETVPKSSWTSSSVKIKQLNDATMHLISKIIGFLDEKMSTFQRYFDIYNKPREIFDESFEALIDKYTELLKMKIELILEQDLKCEDVTKRFNKDIEEIKIFTDSKQKVISDCNREINLLSTLKNLYVSYSNASSINEIESALEYDQVLTVFFDKTSIINASINKVQNSILFNPISIQLKQGNIYQPFHQLSFGQKCGIILKMVLDTADEGIMVIDQPEDNLDTKSIINMLTPTLNRSLENRQVIIATHNSNLVMGLTVNKIIVLESLGSKGRIKTSGDLTNRDVLKGMLDVLEGGLSAFEFKMKHYDDFINLVRKDLDILKIEHSFRKKIIDGLRNLLQPVISDRSLLDFARHELKQRDISPIMKISNQVREHISGLIVGKDGNDLQLLTKLDDLCSKIDNHISKFSNAIEEIRMMDVEVRKQETDLYNLLVTIKNEHLSKISANRNITIQVNENLSNKFVKIDLDHFKIVFSNLFNNSLRATEKQIITEWQARKKEMIAEMIEISFCKETDEILEIQFKDNGFGMEPDIFNRLYIEQCSDQQGSDHGLGGLIISKLLNLNGCSIQVEESKQGIHHGTIQKISLTKI